MERQAPNSQAISLPKIKTKFRSLTKDQLEKSKFENSPYKRLPRIKKMNKSVSSSLSSFPSVSLNLTSSNNLIPENDLVHLTSELQSNKVPSPIIKTYSELLKKVSSTRAGAFINKELEDLSSHSALVLKCLKSYASWKDSLDTVAEMVEFLGKNHGWVKLKDVVNECASSLSTHSLLALNVSELVLAWKEHLRSSLSWKGAVEFIVKEREFFSELKESCDFLTTSHIQSAFCFCKSDPFLISCMKEIPAHKKNTYNFSVDKNKIFLNMSKKLIERIKQITSEFEKQEEYKKAPEDPSKSTIKPKHQAKHSDMKKICKLFSDRLILECLSSLLPQLARESSIDALSQSITKKYLSNLTGLITESVKQSLIEFQSEISSKNAEKLHLHNIIESIIRNLIEEEISNLNLLSLCESEVNSQIKIQSQAARNPEAKRRLTRISLNFELEKLSDLLFNTLVEDFIQEPWLIQLAENGFQLNRRKTIIPSVINNKPVEEVEDFALEVFTPGIHSPNHISDKESSFEESFQDERKEDSPKKMFSNMAVDLKNIKIEPVNEDLMFMKKTVAGYFEQLPKELFCCLDDDSIWAQKEKFINTQFFWIVYEGNVAGFFCYSQENLGNWIVHHISCLNIKFFEELVGNFREFSGLMAGDVVLQFREDVVRVKVLGNVLKKKNFLMGKNGGGLVEYVNRGGKGVTSNFHFHLSSVCTIETSNSCPFNQKSVPEMIHLGNHHSIISLLLHFLSTKPLQPSFEETPVRLQQDLNELLEIINSLNFRSYHKIKVEDSGIHLIEKCEELGLNSNFSQKNPASFSIIDLVFGLSSVSFISHSISGNNYKYLLFPSFQVKSEDSTLMFIVATSDPDISIFFLKSPNIRRELNQGLKVGKTDLFYNIDNLIKSLQIDEKFEGNLLVPCFNKVLMAKVPWIEGYSIETDSGNLVVSGFQESFKVSMEFLGNPNKTFKFAENKKLLIEDDFVFGVFSKQVLDSIESPFYLVLIGREDFVKCS